MSEQFDPEEISAVADAMSEYERRCDELMTLLNDKRHLSIDERLNIQRLYQELKDDLKRDAKFGTLDGERRAVSRSEQCFFSPAVRQAAIALRPATNSNPIASKWFHAVQAAQMELSYYQNNLKRCLPSG
jgi:hypothetical protein